MNVVCKHCGALHWSGELPSHSPARSFGFCCSHGQVSIPADPDPPAALIRLFTSNSPDAREFRENIRQYNAAFAFTSLGVDVDERLNRDGGRHPYVFRIQGELYHHVGSLVPPDDHAPRYAQLYIYDSQFALNARAERNSNLSRETLRVLQETLTETHRYVQLYRHAFEVLRHTDAPELGFRLVADPNRDPRRYNLPAAREIAAILPGDGTEDADRRDIILRKRHGPLQRISDGHPAYACLHYVLLFPWGSHGWQWRIPQRNPETGDETDRRVSQASFYAYQIQVRRGSFQTLLHGGRLFQQYVVDVWASCDQAKLRYLRMNQPRLRAALYSGLEDAVQEFDANLMDDGGLHRLGRRVVLPSSYTGGPRYFQQLYQDAMAIGRYFRKIDLFITVTCNPDWPEIQRELLPGQSAADRPDLVARVFKLYINAILDDLTKKHVLGRVVGYIYVIEFQKRGLPHMHLLLFLDERDRLRTPADIDTVIQAYWPNPDTEPVLFDVVKKTMVHGPCKPGQCLENGKCKRHFPKPFQQETLMTEDGYPAYKRPHDGRSYEVRGRQTDNSWIVPFNPFLSAKYRCHINVESTVSFASLKYLHKYITKGSDRATVQIQTADGNISRTRNGHTRIIDRNDEITIYVDARYIGPTEGMWRLYEYGLHRQKPSVQRLQIHLPGTYCASSWSSLLLSTHIFNSNNHSGQHRVVFDPEEDPHIVRARAAQERTMLTEYFRANADPMHYFHPPPNLHAAANRARQYTYQEFPQYFTWDNTHDCWKIRQGHFSIGRMYFVSPTAGEQFYLRTLLTVVRGATSFDDLRSYNGQLCPSFRDACLQRGLLDDDGEWRLCLREACEMQTGSRLRDLFATILYHCNPTRPERLWNEFRIYICDDLRHALRTLGLDNPSEDDIYDYGLFLLNKALRPFACVLADFPPMPLPQRDWEALRGNALILEHLNFDPNHERTLAEQLVAQLNDEQRLAYDDIMDSIRNKRGRFFFINGPGGTGKTYVYRAICHSVRADGGIILCVASSGIAALLLPGGRTSHSMFRIPIDNLTDGSLCNVDKNSRHAELFQRVCAVIWDEGIMQER